MSGERCSGGRHSHVDTAVKSGGGREAGAFGGAHPSMQGINIDVEPTGLVI